MISRAVTWSGLTVLFSGCLFSQPAADRPAFDVADVQLSKFKPSDPVQGRFVNSRIDVSNATLKRMIIEAYSIPDDYLVGGPSWLDNDRFDIVAKAPPGTADGTLRKMLQTLLADRFKLVIHNEDRVKQVYVLTIGKGGAKLKESAPDAKENCGNGQGDSGMNHVACTGLSMDTVVRQLPRMAPRWVDAPVVDQTGLKGKYDFQLDWHGRPDSNSGAPTDPGIISMFDAVEKLGLKLEPRKIPRPVIVIDKIERTPTEN